MSTEIFPKSESELRKDYPIDNRLTGWFFRIVEVSSGAYLAEGSDVNGRRVSRSGGDPDQVLDQCISDARSIQGQLA